MHQTLVLGGGFDGEALQQPKTGGPLASEERRQKPVIVMARLCQMRVALVLEVGRIIPQHVGDRLRLGGWRLSPLIRREHLVKYGDQMIGLISLTLLVVQERLAGSFMEPLHPFHEHFGQIVAGLDRTAHQESHRERPSFILGQGQHPGGIQGLRFGGPLLPLGAGNVRENPVG